MSRSEEAKAARAGALVELVATVELAALAFAVVGSVVSGTHLRHPGNQTRA